MRRLIAIYKRREDRFIEGEFMWMDRGAQLGHFKSSASGNGLAIMVGSAHRGQGYT